MRYTDEPLKIHAGLLGCCRLAFRAYNGFRGFIFN
jgi:hypothetical protein